MEQALPEADGEAASPEEQKTDAGRKAAPKRKKRAGRILAILVPVIAVLAALTVLIPTAVLPAVRRSSAYSAAEDLYRAGQYAEAMEAFEALGGYRDSAERAGSCADAIMEPQYEDAHHLFENGQYAEAMEAFGALGGYQDSAERAEACRTILDGRYEAALEAFEAGYYETAREVFEALDGYRDSAEFVSRCEDAMTRAAADRLEGLQDAQVGGTVLFGAFEQDNDFVNGAEEIEWIVLTREDDRILVISRYGLMQRPFNDGSAHRVTWENCSLREWLNGEFLETSFSEEELARILTTDLRTLRDPENSSSPGVDTQDRVFLLDITEAETYFSSDEDRVCGLLPESDEGAAVAFERIDEIGDVGLGALKTVRAHVVRKHRPAHVERDHHVAAFRRHLLRAVPPLRTRRRKQAERKTREKQDCLHEKRLRAVRQQAPLQRRRNDAPEPRLGTRAQERPERAGHRHEQDENEHPWIHEAHYTSLLEAIICTDTAASTSTAPHSRNGGKYSR